MFAVSSVGFEHQWKRALDASDLQVLDVRGGVRLAVQPNVLPAPGPFLDFEVLLLFRCLGHVEGGPLHDDLHDHPELGLVPRFAVGAIPLLLVRQRVFVLLLPIGALCDGSAHVVVAPGPAYVESVERCDWRYEPLVVVVRRCRNPPLVWLLAKARHL